MRAESTKFSKKEDKLRKSFIYCIYLWERRKKETKYFPKYPLGRVSIAMKRP